MQLKHQAIGNASATSKLKVTHDGKDYVTSDFYGSCQLMYEYLPQDVVSVELVSVKRSVLTFAVELSNGETSTGRAYARRQRNPDRIGLRQGGGPRSYRRVFSV